MGACLSYTFNLTDVRGSRFTWTIERGDIAVDRHGHVLAFTVRFDDGSTASFAIGNAGGFVRTLLSTKLDAAAGAGAGMAVGRRYGVVGSAIGAVAGWIMEEVAENVLLHNADYYNEAGNLVFRGVIKLQ